MNNAAAFTGIAIFELPLSNGKVVIFAGDLDFEKRVNNDVNAIHGEKIKAIFVPCQFSQFICLN